MTQMPISTIKRRNDIIQNNCAIHNYRPIIDVIRDTNLTLSKEATRILPMLESRYKDYTLHKPNVRRGYVDSSNDDAFEKSIITAVREKAPKPLIAIDMSDIKHMSSAGHRVLLMASKEAAKTGGKVILANVNETIWERLEMSGFTTIFERTTLRPLRRRK